MAYSEKLAKNIRQALAHLPNVEEIKMFGGIAFMVDGKMCLTAGADSIMCRIDPGMHDELVEKKSCYAVVMKGRELKGYVYVSEEHLQTRTAFNYWVTLALEFNKRARASVKKTKKIQR